MAQAQSGDAIHVAPGIYNLALGETFPIVVTSGVHLKSTGTAENTFLDATGANRRVLELLNASAATIVEGLTVMGGLPEAPAADFGVNVGGGMTIIGGAPLIRRNVFANNEARGRNGEPIASTGSGRGGGLYVSGAAATIVNNVFRGNAATGGNGTVVVSISGGSARGGGIYYEGGAGAITNNTIYGNSAQGGRGGFFNALIGGAGGSGSHGGVYAEGPTVTNNIIAGNRADGGAGGGVSVMGPNGTGAYGGMQSLNAPSPPLNNLFFGNKADGVAGTDDTLGNASLCYTLPCAGVGFHGEPSNLRITPQSPAVGAGTAVGAPSDDLLGLTRPDSVSIGAYEPTASPARVVNVSTRMQVLTGDDVMIAGFIIGGSTPKTVVVRAQGPALGLPGLLADPVINLYSGSTLIGSNDDWGTAANVALLRASGFAPSDTREAAIVATLAPGAYTAIVSGTVPFPTGLAIVEVFEVDQPGTPLINISTRGRVQTGDNVMIAGFIVQGDGPQTVVVRARGPSLSQFNVPGVLADPVLTLFSGATPIAINDNWQLASNGAAIQASGFAPLHPNESAILITLQPGAYTAIVSGAGGSAGVAIVEVFRN